MHRKNVSLIAAYADADYPNDERLRKYILSKAFDVVELHTGHLFLIEKESIKTNFCFGYGLNGVTTEEEYNDANSAAASMGYGYFIDENTKDLKALINALENGAPAAIAKCTRGNLAGVYTAIHDSVLTDEEMLRAYAFPFIGKDSWLGLIDDVDREKLLTVYRAKLDDKEKRCASYWKCYGKSKLNCWSYLVD